MRNAATVLRIIQDRGRRRLPLEDVYRQLYNPDLYLRAYGRLYTNKGAMTPGATVRSTTSASWRTSRARGAGRNQSGCRSWRLASGKRWSSAAPATRPSMLDGRLPGTWHESLESAVRGNSHAACAP